jgi:hypothetical protein
MSKTLYCPMLFKVLVDMKSCHGGEYTYTVGKWTPRITPSCYNSGWHVTSDPIKWWKPKAKIYLAVGDGAINSDNIDKAAFERVKLIEEVTWDWKYLYLFPRLRLFLSATARSLDQNAYLSGADLSGAYLSGAYLSGAHLSRADLSGADLSGAYLSGADLSRADLSGAYLSGADLSRADLSGAYRPIDPPNGYTVTSNGYLVKA